MISLSAVGLSVHHSICAEFEGGFRTREGERFCESFGHC